MELVATDRDRLAFLLETDAALDLDFEALQAQAEAAAEEPSPEERPKFITNYIGSKQKLVDWIWKHGGGGIPPDAFSGSAVVAYMYKTKACGSWPTTGCATNLIALADFPLGESLDLLSCQAGKAESVRVTGFMGSKYLMLGWIESHVPKDAESILDAFSGGANVAYHFKRKGLKVITNDLLRYPHHLSRAVMENSSETLSDEDVDRILAPNADAGTFIVDHFYGYYTTKPVLRWLDQVWANIQKLHGYKKDLTLAALGTTVKFKSAFGQFSRSKMHRKAETSTRMPAWSNPSSPTRRCPSSSSLSGARWASSTGWCSTTAKTAKHSTWKRRKWSGDYYARIRR